MFIDCHAHLYHPEPTRESLIDLIKKAKEKNISQIVGAIVDPKKYFFMKFNEILIIYLMF